MSERESDLKSFPNESVSSTYEGPNRPPDEPTTKSEIAQTNMQSLSQGIPVDQFNFKDTMQSLMQQYLNAVDSKSDEVIQLRVSLSNFQAELDRKDDICQQQALKISDLNKIIDDLKSELESLKKEVIDKKTVSSIKMRYANKTCLIVYQ